MRNGYASGLQRYKCRGCGKTFNALTGTALARLRMKGKWLEQQRVLQQGLSVHKAAAQLGVGPATAFRWRHRFLQAAREVKATSLVGVVEADETFFRRSFKGQTPIGRRSRKRGGKASKNALLNEQIPVLVARDRSASTADFVLQAASEEQIVRALSARVQPDAVLCTDGSPAMAAAAKTLNVEHECVNLSAGIRVRGPWHIQNANGYHSRLKRWMHRFNGVATDYLESYLGWFRALDRCPNSNTTPVPFLALALGLGRDH